MLLNKLESGFLLFQTEQGLVAVEPSFWQRVYLLWTFRNFRQLSLPLLNPRQATLINSLFREQAEAVAEDFEPSLKIGVVENFVPPAPEIVPALAIGAAPAAATDAPAAIEADLPEPTAEQDALNLAPPATPTAAAPDLEADVPPAVRWEDAEEEGTVIDHAEIAPRSALDRLFAPPASWLRRASANPATSNPVSSNPPACEPAATRFQMSRMTISMFAAAIGAIALCVGFGLAFHRIGAVPGSPARSSSPQISAPDSPSAPEPTAPQPTPIAENPDPEPEVSPKAVPDPAAAVKPPSPKAASSTTTTHRVMTPVRASRGVTAPVASRSSGGSHAAAFSKVPASASTRRMTSAPASGAVMPRSAQSYFELANQQMHQGNYAAAAANYRRAWRIQEKNAARGRQARARRTTQAEKQNVASRR